jgi:hypothetical protein
MKVMDRMRRKNGLHSPGRVIFITPSFEMCMDVEVDVAGWHLAYSVAPQAEYVVAHRKHSILHCVSSSGVTTGRIFFRFGSALQRIEGLGLGLHIPTSKGQDGVLGKR